MPSFRPAKDQAHHAISELVAFGESHHENKGDGRVYSISTAHSHEGALARFTTWVQVHKLGDLRSATADTALLYLAERSESGIKQKALDGDRQALQALLGQKLERLRALVPTELHTRSYTHPQAGEVAAHQTERFALSTQLVEAAGLRAHELLTLRPISERGPSTHREWSSQRFAGRQGVLYSVVGKGGLIRAILLPSDLAARLESRRLDAPREVWDRGIKYMSHYDIPGGQRWSESFGHASAKWLGWSNGGHGLRHTYAQDRMNELQGAGYLRPDALEITSQEMGHFDPHTTETYLR